MEKYFMNKALELAKMAYESEEIPVGAVIVKDGEIIGEGFNRKETGRDPTLHAEIIAIRNAAQKLDSWRLTDCIMYSTLEPCPMCAGALVNSRIKKLVIGVRDYKTGACGSVMNVVSDPNLNHKIEVEFGILEEEAKKLLQDFFLKLRRK